MWCFHRKSLKSENADIIQELQKLQALMITTHNNHNRKGAKDSSWKKRRTEWENYLEAVEEKCAMCVEQERDLEIRQERIRDLERDLEINQERMAKEGRDLEIRQERMAKEGLDLEISQERMVEKMLAMEIWENQLTEKERAVKISEIEREKTDKREFDILIGIIGTWRTENEESSVVAMSGAVEITLLRALYMEYITLQKKTEDARILCCVCLDRRKNIVFAPCYHMCVCLLCSKNLGVCPLCRVTITLRKEIY